MAEVENALFVMSGGCAIKSGAQDEALAKDTGDLDLSGLTGFTDSQAKTRARHAGKNVLLNGLTSLSDKVAAMLRENPAIQLPEKFLR